MPSSALNLLSGLQARTRTRWLALAPIKRRWLANAALGVAVEVLVLLAQAFHVAYVEHFQTSGLDMATRMTHTVCGLLDERGAGAGWTSRRLHCPAAMVPTDVPVLVDIDSTTWRSARWDGGEPVRAPRAELATLLENTFELGAREVVLDVLVQDRQSPGVAAPPANSSAAQAMQDDQAFADRLRGLLAKPSFALAAGRQLVLVRNLREPLPEDRATHLPEIRESAAVDRVIAESGGRIAGASSYFQVDRDRLTRNWNLFKVVCARDARAPERGTLRIVPSVQLVIAAHRAGVSLPGPSAGDEAAATCDPFPLRDSAGSASDAAPGQRADAISRTLLGTGASQDDDPCEAREGLEPRYWCRVRRAFARQAAAQPLAGLPLGGDLGNRIVFRHAGDDQPHVTALSLLASDLQDREPVRALVEGRTLVIGQTYPESGDFFETPLGRMPGATVLANAIDSMRVFGLMRKPDPWLFNGAVFLLIVAVAGVFARWQSMLAGIIATAIIVLVAGTAGFLLFSHGVWLDFAAPLLAIQLHKFWTVHAERAHYQRLKAQHATTT
jgi:CHASE2 domain-containing sensor protein